MPILLRCHPGIGPAVTGTALVAKDNFSARYDLDRKSGTFSRPTHALAGQSYIGRILVLDQAKGAVGLCAGAYLLSDTGRSDWYRNLEARPEVSLEIGGERRDTMARPVPADDAANAVVRAAMVAKYQPGYEENLAEWSERASLVRIEWPAEP